MMPHVMMIEEQGQYGSDDVRAWTEGDGVILAIACPGGDAVRWSDLDWQAALRLGEWLIAQAIARGARPDRSGGTK